MIATSLIGGDWSTVSDMERDFSTSEVYDYHIIVAGYSYEDYSGEAYVLCSKDGILYEVEGSHCSCYVLEDQWKPAEVTVAYLRNRLEKGCFTNGCGIDIAEAVRCFLDCQPSEQV